MKVTGLDREFTVIGENIHCTRVLLRKGKRIGPDPDGNESVLWTDPDGAERFLPIPDDIKESSDYGQGRVKHIQVAVKAAMAGGEHAQTGLDYLRWAVKRQVDAGVDFLDVNVDEISPKVPVQQETMDWLVRTVQSMTDAPLSIDSSLMEIIDTGMTAYDASVGRPMLNSASLERIEAVDLAAKPQAHVVITSAGEASLPEDTAERIGNATKTVDIAVSKGIPPSDIHVDLLVFPIAVDSTYGKYFLDAARGIRDHFGPDIHITGGMSNVSFGLPARKLVNEAFINLAIEHGADSAIIDPVASNITAIIAADRDAEAYQLACKVLLGEDLYCENFIQAFRDGALAV
ncbi:MAG: hypothetical protein CMJ49_14740 [Planctomycetaceae bacterium]|nr:hypothetical protein [Planctomycetaceae bacterium]